MDRFGTLTPIGEGQMGAVFEGYDSERQCRVAIKLLKSTDPDAVRRMQREAAVLSRVRHPNVCEIHEFGESDGQPWITMPLIEGCALDQAWQELPLDARVDVLIDICRGVEAAHAAGLIHRDIKPANILVCSDEQGSLTPLVMDFGIARAEHGDESALTATGEIVGTPESMAPEQVRGEREQIDRRTDVWGIGGLLYRALCDRPPFEGKSAAEVMTQIIHRDVPNPRRYQSAVPGSLARICMQCLEREPARRYADVSAIREDLQRYRSGLAVWARDTGIGYALRRSWHRNRLAWSVGAVMTVGLLLAMSAWVYARIDAVHREVLARELGATREMVRSRMHIAYLAPLHDLRAEREALARIGREAMAHLAGESEGIRTLARRSLGLSALALGDYHEVVATLTPLASAGLADGTDLRALASAHLQLYQLAADRFADLPDAERNSALSGARERDLLPARAYLASTGATDGLERVRLLLIDNSFDDARHALTQIPAEPPTEYARQWLSGDLAMAEAAHLAGRGQRESAQQAYATAQALFEVAASTARSDGRVLRRVCDAALGGYRQRLSLGAAAPASPQALHAACGDALVANPSDPKTHETLAAVWEAIAQNHDLRHEVAAMTQALKAAIQHADLALQQAPELLGARLIGARALHLQAGHLADDLDAGLALYDRAIAMLDPLLVDAPGFAPGWLLRGRLLSQRTRLLNNHSSQDHVQSFDLALTALREARRLRPQDPDTINALGLALVFQFYILRNQDLASAARVMDEAIALLDEALTTTPDDPELLFSQGANLGDLWAAQANWSETDAGFDAATPTLERGLSLLARLRSVAPGRADGYAQAIAQLATYGELARARSLPRLPQLLLAQAIAAEAASAGISLDQSLLAWLTMERAVALDEVDSDEAAKAFADSDRHLRAAMSDPEELYSATRQRLEWVVARLRWTLRKNLSVTATIAQGEATIKALLAHPRGAADGIVYCNAGAFHWLLGEHAITAEGLAPVARIAQANQAFARCQQLNASYARRWSALADAAAAWVPAPREL
ncbi:MAG: protein kinase [Lysobacterales bacterium]